MKLVARTLCAAVAVIAISARTTLAVLAWAPQAQPVAAKHGIPGPAGPTGEPGPKGERGPRGPKAPVDANAPTTKMFWALDNKVMNLEEWQITECRRLAHNAGGDIDAGGYVRALMDQTSERFDDLNCENLGN